MPRITRLSVRDIRFPTSSQKDGSDAMNPDPDYSSAYVILHTDAGLEGHGSMFTIGRGNDVVCAAIRAHQHLLLGRALAEFTAAPGPFLPHLTRHSHLRWFGSVTGGLHLRTGWTSHGTCGWL